MQTTKKASFGDTLDAMMPLMESVPTATQVKLQWLLIQAMAYDLDKISAFFDAEMKSLAEFADRTTSISETDAGKKTYLTYQITKLIQELS